MKHFFCKCILILCVFVVFLVGCATSSKGSKEKMLDPTKEQSSLEDLNGDLWDVNTGTKLGVYEFKKDGNDFYFYVQTEETKGLTTSDGVKTFSAFEGIFEGAFNRTKDGLLLYGSDDNENYYVIIHDLPAKMLPANLPNHEKSEKTFLISIMDKPIFEEVFLAKKSKVAPMFAIHALKPFMRTHAIVLQ